MSPLPPDPYKILGVAKDAQISEIRSAHRKLVLKCHPDKVHDPALKLEKQDEFQKVQQAYELLSDEVERQKYDDKVRLEELRRQFQTKANISSPRASPRYSAQEEARGMDSRSSPFRASTASSGVKYTYTRPSDEDLERGAHASDATPRSSRREASYAEKPSKRDMERERERERDTRERDRDRDREKERDRERRRRQEDAARRYEKEAKEARRAEKRAREKQRDKEVKRETEEKKRHAKPYTEPYGDDAPTPKSDKKKSSSSSSKKHGEKRDRSSGREDMPTPASMPSSAPQQSYTYKVDYATSYIQASKAKSGAAAGSQRSATYAVPVQPPAPTPPPIHGHDAPFPPPDDNDARRSSGRTRRGSGGDDPRLSRERSYHGAPSHEALRDPPVVNASPSSRHAAQFPKTTSSGNPMMPSMAPRTDLPRTTTMPPQPVSYSRPPPPGMSRAQTFSVFDRSGDYNRGRDRTRMQPQVEVESDSEDAYGRRRDRKHRSSRRHHSPEQLRTENVSRYQVDGSRSRLHSSYVRHVEPEFVESYPYYGYSADGRPSMPAREAGYSGASTAKFPKIKTSKSYGYDDVQYSYYDQPSHEEYAYG
ncbi:hypothetical protein E4U53_000821 [Claviceps sorghi]|nr:hypothetical protein E4U53_000821 [Claviceps sorghi]